MVLVYSNSNRRNTALRKHQFFVNFYGFWSETASIGDVGDTGT